MEIIPFLPESIVGEEFGYRVDLHKRQLVVLLKMDEPMFKEHCGQLDEFFRSFFYFYKSADGPLARLALRVLRRCVPLGGIGLETFIDAISLIPRDELEPISKRVKNVPESFTEGYAGLHPVLLEAWKILHPNQPKDEAVVLLDDKTFVDEHRQSFRDAQYEDELVDNGDFFDGDQEGEDVPFASYSDTEAALFEAYIDSPELLQRSARKSPERAALLSSLGITHEQAEGWATMLNRNPNRKVLIKRFHQWQTDRKFNRRQ